MSFDHHLAAGAAGGIVTSMLLHPLDLVKVRLQVQDGRTVATRYRGVVSAVTGIAGSEGARGFYRGVIPAMWGSGASWGLYFYFYEACKRRMIVASAAQNAGDGGVSGPGRPADGRGKGPPLTMAQNMYAAWEGGTITCFFTNPLWLVKTRLQLQTGGPGVGAARGGGCGAISAHAPAGTPSVSGLPHAPAASTQPPAYRGMMHALATIVREEGPLGLYRGLLPALLLVSHGMVQFAVYEELKSAMAPIWGAGGSAAAATPPAGALLPPSTGGPALGPSRSSSAEQKQGRGPAPLTTADSALEAGEHWGLPFLRSVPHSTALFLAGAGSKAVATTVTYPYQVIKSRMQQRFAGSGGPGPEAAAATHPYRTFLTTLRAIAAHEGAAGFYKGFVANLLRVAPQSAVTLVAYEHALTALDLLDRAPAAAAT